MGRPKTFNPGDAMKEAMAAFWDRGYRATSVSDLLAEMKLNRGSLYDTFGDKKSLFLAALAEYERQCRQSMIQTLERPGSAKAAIRNWVSTTAESCAGQQALRGCMGMKAAIEMGPEDTDVAEFFRRVTREREQVVARAIKRGQADGEISRTIEPRAVARYLLTSLAGLRMLGMSAPREKDVREVVALILKVLD